MTGTGPADRFRLAAAPDADLDLIKEGEPLCRLGQRPCVLADFEARACCPRIGPGPDLIDSLVRTRVVGGGRITLSGDKLVIPAHGDGQEGKLAVEEAVLSAYHDQFGFRFDEVPKLRRRLRNGL